MGIWGNRTLKQIVQCFYWFGVREVSDIWVEKCDTCVSVKKPPQKPQAPLGTMPVGAPLDRLATDILGPLPLTPRGNQYILLVTYHFTKWLEIFPVPDQMATACAEVILNEVIAIYGSPLSIHSDHGKSYERKVFADLWRFVKQEPPLETPYVMGKQNGSTKLC